MEILLCFSCDVPMMLFADFIERNISTSTSSDPQNMSPPCSDLAVHAHPGSSPN